jgi:glycosyltransferase involved in cell wall biosynthesis
MPRLSTSVAMCTCNGSLYVRKQLESIARQTVAPTELIIGDDASTDDTVKLLHEFAGQAPFATRILENPARMGPAKNFENVIRRCAGEIIFLADQDDLWHPTKIERMLTVFENPAAAYAFSDAQTIDGQGQTLPQNLWETVGFRRKREGFSGASQVEILLRHNLITGATMAFRASFRDLFLPLAPEWMHDYWIALLGSVVFTGVAVDEPLMMYRRHGAQVCGWRKKSFGQVFKSSLDSGSEAWSGKVRNFQALLDRVGEIAKETPCLPANLELLKDKEKHMLSRARARSINGPRRLAKVISEAFTGRYQRYSNSWYSIIRDL